MEYYKGDKIAKIGLYTLEHYWEYKDKTQPNHINDDGDFLNNIQWFRSVSYIGEELLYIKETNSKLVYLLNRSVSKGCLDKKIKDTIYLIEYDQLRYYLRRYNVNNPKE